MHQTIGTKIRILRQRHNLTQEQLAQLLDVSCDTVCRWESDSVAPDLALLPKLALHLQATPEELTGSISNGTAPQASTVYSANALISLLLSLIGFAAAAIANSFGMPLAGFATGAVLIAVGMILSIRRPQSHWILFAELILLGALLPLILISPDGKTLPAMQWLTFGAAFALITGVVCLSARFILLADRSAPGSVLRSNLRYLWILLAVLLILGILHFLVGYFLTDSLLLYPNKFNFDNWEDFRAYMQQPLSSDGKTQMFLLSVENSEGNLVYRFSDPNNGIVEIRDALQIIPAPVGGEPLCTFLHLNQYVSRFILSSQGNLPVRTITVADELRAQQILTTVHIVFTVLYLSSSAFFLLFLRRKNQKVSEIKDAAHN